MTTPNRPLLWEAMQDAYFNSRISPRHGYAAEIRALRDWLVPEEKAPPPAGYPAWGGWQERQRQPLP